MRNTVLAALVACAFVVGTGRTSSADEPPPLPYVTPLDPAYAPPAGVATLDEVIRSGRDLWGEAALKQPGGPSYEFFEKLLPPLRYCDAPFRHYPITLSAPGGAPTKVRFISNGSAINALARTTNWMTEGGIPVYFRVGDELEAFGEDLKRLDGPRYERGYLPIVQLRYHYGPHVYTQEAFASVDPKLAASGVAFVRLGVAEGPKDQKGKVEAQIESSIVLRTKGNVVPDKDGKAIACFEPTNWWYNPGRCSLNARLAPGESVVFAIYTKPGEAIEVTPAVYDEQRAMCAKAWDDVLAGGTSFTVPEKVADDGWRAAFIGMLMLQSNGAPFYSHGNSYGHIYIFEGGDVARTTAMFNHPRDAAAMMPSLFNHHRSGLRFHQAAFKLQMIAHLYALSRDAEMVRKYRQLSEEGRKPGWQTELDLLMTSREPDSKLYPVEQYAGDLTNDMVQSLHSNAAGWRAIRDMSVVLEDIGEKDLAAKCRADADAFRPVILSALGKSIDRSVDPPFIPIALFGKEKPYQHIVESRRGSYYNIQTRMLIGSAVFPYDDKYTDDLIRYIRERGGLCMGLSRNHPSADTWWVYPRGINDLYGMRYGLLMLQRDEVDQALVGFYGKLAQGFTRDTFICGEGSMIVPVYGNGRQFYLPPNSAGNAHYLQLLRYMLVQDYDLDDDARPETLRLLFGTPRRWLEDGKTIKIERAATTFGEVSAVVQSRLNDGEVTAELKLPAKAPTKTLLRLRLPEGWKLTGAQANGQKVDVRDDTITLTPLREAVKVRATVAKS
jgi:hypothetical protein